MPCLRKLSSTKITMKTMKQSDVFQLGFNNKRNLTQPLRACKSFICRHEGETEHFTIKNRLPLFGQPLIEIFAVYCQKHPASRAFLCLLDFGVLEKRLCMNRVRSLLNMRCMLPGYSLEPKPNMPDLAAAVSWYNGLNYNHRFCH